jgi:hypothetical protein
MLILLSLNLMERSIYDFFLTKERHGLLLQKNLYLKLHLSAVFTVKTDDFLFSFMNQLA